MIGAAVLVGVVAFRVTSPDAAASPSLPSPEALTPATAAAERRPTGGDEMLGSDPVPAESVPPSTASVPGGVTCTADMGWQLSYPADWYAAGCDLFSPWPIESPDDALVTVLSLTGTWDEVIVVATPDDREVVDSIETSIAGRRALVVTSRQTEPGWYEVGARVYEIYVDDGWRLVVFSTASVDDEFAVYAQVVDGLAASLIT
ncbi:MAG: hypothetical protein ABMA25_28190 [Ilumatobacteraceae bacterium]